MYLLMSNWPLSSGRQDAKSMVLGEGKTIMDRSRFGNYESAGQILFFLQNTPLFFLLKWTSCFWHAIIPVVNTDYIYI